MGANSPAGQLGPLGVHPGDPAPERTLRGLGLVDDRDQLEIGLTERHDPVGRAPTGVAAALNRGQAVPRFKLPRGCCQVGDRDQYVVKLQNERAYLWASFARSSGRFTLRSVSGSAATTATSSSASASLSASSPASRRRSSTGNAFFAYAPGSGPVKGTATSTHASPSSRTSSGVTSGASTGRKTATSFAAARSPATTPAIEARTPVPSSVTSNGKSSSPCLPTASRSSQASPSTRHARSASVSPSRLARAFGDPNRRLAPPTSRTPVSLRLATAPSRRSHDRRGRNRTA